jgi:RNA polymerase sigma factor (sigma-70 family)
LAISLNPSVSGNNAQNQLIQMEEIIDIYKEFLSGDRTGFDPIYLTWKAPLVAYGLKLFMNNKVVEDAVSDAFYYLLLRIGTFETKKHIVDFLHLTVWNRCQTERIKSQRIIAFPDDADLESEFTATQWINIKDSLAFHLRIIQKIKDNLVKLPRQQREDFHARFFKQKSIGQIAGERGVSENTIRRNVKLGVKKIDKYVNVKGINF